MHNTDNNHYEILNKDDIGWLGGSVHHTPQVGGGFPDGVTGWPGATVVTKDATADDIQRILRQAGIACNVYDGANILVEVKSENGGFTAAQYAWTSEWRGGYLVARTPDIIRAIPPWTNWAGMGVR